MLEKMVIMPTANATAWGGTAAPAPEMAAPDPARCKEMPTHAEINKTTASRTARIINLPGT
jgi:hypothetical protein